MPAVVVYNIQMNDQTNTQTVLAFPDTHTSAHACEPVVRQSRTASARPATPARQTPTGGSFRDALFSGIPLVQTRLVREHTFCFATREHVKSPADAAAIMTEYFQLHDREAFVVGFLDTANALTALHVATVGGLAASIVEPRQVFKAAILANASALLCFHNHPSHNPEPSREDVAVTKQLVEAGRLLGIPVHDHIIIAGHGYTSLAERGLM